MKCCGMEKMPQYRHRIDIINPKLTGDTDATGTPVTTEQIYLRTRAEIIPLVPSQLTQADQQTGILRYRIRLPFSRIGMGIRHEMLVRVHSNAFPDLTDLEIDGPPSNEEGASRVIRIFAVQRQQGTM